MDAVTIVILILLGAAAIYAVLNAVILRVAVRVYNRLDGSLHDAVRMPAPMEALGISAVITFSMLCATAVVWGGVLLVAAWLNLPAEMHRILIDRLSPPLGVLVSIATLACMLPSKLLQATAIYFIQTGAWLIVLAVGLGLTLAVSPDARAALLP